MSKCALGDYGKAFDSSVMRVRILLPLFMKTPEISAFVPCAPNVICPKSAVIGLKCLILQTIT